LDRPTEIEKLTRRIERAMHPLVSAVARERFWITHYGANDIHPRHLVYWIVVQTDAEKRRLEADQDLTARLRALLDLHDYPVEGRAGVHVGFDSQETCDRESGGDWWQHWR
jgi:hypothetical protein